jgi:hypothetical protein
LADLIRPAHGGTATRNDNAYGRQSGRSREASVMSFPSNQATSVSFWRLIFPARRYHGSSFEEDHLVRERQAGERVAGDVPRRIRSFDPDRCRSSSCQRLQRQLAVRTATKTQVAMPFGYLSKGHGDGELMSARVSRTAAISADHFSRLISSDLDPSSEPPFLPRDAIKPYAHVREFLGNFW